MEETAILRIVDYVVIIAVLLIPMAIGIFFAIRDSRNATREEYLLGGRKMSLGPVMLSLFVTYQSAISLMGIPSDVYYYGAMVFTIYIGYCASYVIAIYTFVPLLYPLHLLSVFEYLELRFESRTLRLMATVLGMIQTICYMSIVQFTPALALQAALGIPFWMSIVIVGIIGTVYTAIGGIKSVVWTDAFQTVIVFGGMIAIIVKGSIVVGGFDKAMVLAYEGKRLDFDVVDPSVRHSWWGCVIGGGASWIVHMCNQSSMQRICSLKTMKDAKTAYKLNVVLTMSYGIVLLSTGVVVYAYFAHLRCDPYEAGFITNKNQLTPYYVLNALQDMPGAAGLYMAALFCGSLSSLSSGINALAANTVEDFLKTRLASVSESTSTLVTKIIVCVYGLFIVAFAYAAKSLKGPVTQIGGSIFGACGGPLIGIFIVGASVPWVNKYGAMLGGIGAVIISIWAAVGYQIYGVPPQTLPSATTEMCYVNSSMVENVTYSYYSPTTVGSAMTINNYTEPFAKGDPPTANTNTFFLYRISYEWYGAISIPLSFILSVIISLLTRSCTQTKPNPKLIFPFLRKYWSLPEPRHLDTDESNLKVSENLMASAKLIEDFKHQNFILTIAGEKKENEEELSELNLEKRS